TVAPTQTPTPVAAPSRPVAKPSPTPTAVALVRTTPKPRPTPTPAGGRLRLKPTKQDLEFLTSKADTLLSEGRTADAKEQYLYILQQEPGWADAHFGLGKVDESQKDGKGACKEFGQYLTLAPAGRHAFEAGKKMSQCK
ncbi:MAG TPA: hypothetical protein VMV18_14580, partial [bacterium]|nr:hypothetical protein [bacterium]